MKTGKYPENIHTMQHYLTSAEAFWLLEEACEDLASAARAAKELPEPIGAPEELWDALTERAARVLVMLDVVAGADRRRVAAERAREAREFAKRIAEERGNETEK